MNSISGAFAEPVSIPALIHLKVSYHLPKITWHRCHAKHGCREHYGRPRWAGNFIITWDCVYGGFGHSYEKIPESYKRMRRGR